MSDSYTNLLYHIIRGLMGPDDSRPGVTLRSTPGFMLSPAPQAPESII
ncbi:MAG TPA: hypothetical protein VKC61_07345 [Pyrinomonadaceae bacterium]|nr:hypothetical protein [Pyrinomonadaceae bacterium]